jgi:IS30 family transposase
MTSGIPLSEEEKEKIRAEINTKSKRQLAQELNRHRKTIKDFVDTEGLEAD